MDHFFELTPLHPILIHFPLALIPVALATDLLGRWKNNASLTHAGWWTLLFAAIATPATSVSGWIWMRQMADMDHPELVYHQWLGTALPLVLIALALWRFRSHRQARPAPGAYLAVLFLTLIAVMVQGHLGGLMSFGAEPSAPDTATSQPADGHGHDHHHMDNATPATTQPDGDGWSDSIKVKEHHHE